MDEAAQPKFDPEVSPLSKWWLRSVLMVMILGFAGLLAITMLSYRNAPPIPDVVVDARGETLFTGDQIRSGQAIFLRYGLMDNGTIWGHGAYLGPDFSAETLHQIGESLATSLAQQQFAKTLNALTPIETGSIRGQVAVTLKTNRFEPASDTLRLTAPEAIAYRAQTARWTSYFINPARNGGLAPKLITDPAELRDLTAFFCWTAWASVADRPGGGLFLHQQFSL
ncbi:hypothetical protein KRR38_31760 [Novosphingobium sp. G106]|uniref:hypothetical protein n=1 Tax=Novosphingobium sp. G106 TaxID=2849500 RepID=UPI001C2D42E6|nr:hypothetical protein [Novosphingobium sp. G106]MBV1692122.1 hypothetical protein [Novosphingobium sp. G106]